MSQETPIQHLLRSIRVTASARFNMTRRLKLHETFSLWIISLSSLLLIILPLLRPFEIQVRFSENVIDFVSVIAASAILVFSLLVNGSKFAERTEKMHCCALELNSLSRKVELLVNDTQTEDLQLRDFQDKYDEILSRYENHSNIDYKVGQAKKAADHYGVGFLKLRILTLETCLEFIPYIFLAFAEVAFFIVLIA